MGKAEWSKGRTGPEYVGCRERGCAAFWAWGAEGVWGTVLIVEESRMVIDTEASEEGT